MKDIYEWMNTQNILKYYGSNLDLRLDSSEFYDFELVKTAADFDEDVINFQVPINYSGLVINSECITGTSLNSIKPWVLEINKPYSGYSCDFNIRRRTERGWTLDFIFNKETLPWTSGSTFYYWGISGETIEKNYLDNNLSFSFTDDGRIKWEAYRYSGYCQTDSGYTETSYISSGQTGILCSGGTSNDFNITIVFQRNNRYENCDLANMGGWNDLLTGYTVTNPYSVISGDTEVIEEYEVLNPRWSAERSRRLGTLIIYLNGRPIYKLRNWEEVIPSTRESDNPIVQVWGGGTTGITDLHTGTTSFNLKQIKYWEEPLSFPKIKHHYLSVNKPTYTINECSDDCVDNVSFFTSTGILTEEGDYILTEDEYVLTF